MAIQQVPDEQVNPWLMSLAGCQYHAYSNLGQTLGSGMLEDPMDREAMWLQQEVEQQQAMEAMG